MSGPGIDYGRYAGSNRNLETGIHYGVKQIDGDLSQAWADSSESYYGEPTCPKCEGRAVALGPAHADLDLDSFEQYDEHGCADYVCESCQLTLDSSYVYSEEALSFFYESEGYKLDTCFDQSCIMVVESPYFTRAVFCSPCAPGAGDLDNPADDGVRTWCLGHDWYESGQAPYPVYLINSEGIEVRVESTKEESKS
jgi:hypothetical protein